MSYDLNFWKQTPGVKLDPQKVYLALCEGEAVGGLEDLPGDRILARITQAFKTGWSQLDEFTCESVQGAFQVSITRQSFRVDCYGLSGEIMNLFIDIGHAFGCKLYDPQTGVRFEG